MMRFLSLQLLLLSSLQSVASAFHVQHPNIHNNAAAAAAAISSSSSRHLSSTAPTTTGRRSLSSSSSSSKLHMLPPMPNPALFLPHEVLETSKTLMHMYQNALIDNPITTKALTSGVLATAGDLIAQVSAHKTTAVVEGNDDTKPSFDYDLARGICFLAFGAAYTGIFQHYWFDFLGNHITQWGETLHLWGPSHVSIPVRALYELKEWWAYFDVMAALEDPPSNTAVATAKLAVNQFLMIPTVYMPLFFAVTGSLAKLNLEESTDRAKNMYIPLLKRNYFYWLPVQFFQFLVVPQDFQILYISCASLVWTVILSSLATDQQQQQQQQQPQQLQQQQQQQMEQQQLPASTMAVTDSVTLEDLEEALLPEAARNLLENPNFGSTTIGGAFGLLASAANDGLVGGFVSNLLGATIGSGVAVTTAAGAVIGLLLSAQSSDKASESNPDWELLPEEAMRNLPESQLRQQQQQQKQPESSKDSSDFGSSPTLQAQVDAEGVR
ncbi:unnamed protein product [Cylindrotheca closterium]|uniref:Uncharacterized protein n=1 Tax=Cylindrotheca closterium TaxID=2856 RepID=A0AAD2FWR5_9STRA|nr:unnamed protein product [Cylindrotheca closterium]